MYAAGDTTLFRSNISVMRSAPVGLLVEMYGATMRQKPHPSPRCSLVARPPCRSMSRMRAYRRLAWRYVVWMPCLMVLNAVCAAPAL